MKSYSYSIFTCYHPRFILEGSLMRVSVPETVQYGPYYLPLNVFTASEGSNFFWSNTFVAFIFITISLQRESNTIMSLQKLAHAIYRKFCGCKNENFHWKISLMFSYFCSKHRLWVHVRTTLASTHNLCFRAKIRKIGILLQTPVLI